MSIQSSYFVDSSYPVNQNYRLLSFGFSAHRLDLVNDEPKNGQSIYWSWNGQTLAGEIKPKEIYSLVDISCDRIYLKSSNTNPKYRLFLVSSS